MAWEYSRQYRKRVGILKTKSPLQKYPYKYVHAYMINDMHSKYVQLIKHQDHQHWKWVVSVWKIEILEKGL